MDFVLFFLFLAVLPDTWDLNSPARDSTHTPEWKGLESETLEC